MTNSSTPSFKGQDVYCGFDVHKTTWSLTVRLAGIDAFRTTLPADPEIAISTIRHRFPDATVHTVYEAGFSGFHIHRKFVAAGFDSIVVNPADIPTRDKERVFKNDQIDSAKLAKQLEAGMLEGIDVPSPEIELMRGLVRQETQVRGDSTRFNNQLKSWLFFRGLPVPDSLSNATLQQLQLQAEALGDPVIPGHIQRLQWAREERKCIIRAEKNLQERLGFSRVIKLLQTIPGVGYRTASVLQSELGDVSRFPDRDHLASYVGLAPRLVGSGDSESVRGGLRRKKKRLHYLLIQAAWTAVRFAPEFTALYGRLCLTKKKRNRAIISVAKKLLFIAYAIMRDKVAYTADGPHGKGVDAEALAPKSNQTEAMRAKAGEADRKEAMNNIRAMANEEDVLLEECGMCPEGISADEILKGRVFQPSARMRRMIRQ